MISILILTKGHNSVILHVELEFLFSTHCLIMVYICTNFRENISNDFRDMEQT